VVYKDMLCGACDLGCKRNLDMERQLLLESLRARLVEKGYGPLPEHLEMTRNIEETANIYAEDQDRRHDWIPQDARPADKADLLYFVGCRASFRDTAVSQAAARIMKAAGTDYMLLSNEPCCGNYIFTIGQIEKARTLAENNLRLIRESGAKTVVFTCADGYEMVKVNYPKLLGFSTSDLGFEAVHLVELIDRWVKDGTLKLTGEVSKKVTYHDPCRLGRMSEPWFHWEGYRGEWGLLQPTRHFRRGLNGIYEPPRDILRAIPGIELVEMYRHHENAWCCGNAGGVKEAYPDMARWTAAERLREARAVGAEAVVTACPACEEIFREAADGGMEVYDITDLIVRSMEK